MPVPSRSVTKQRKSLKHKVPNLMVRILSLTLLKDDLMCVVQMTDMQRNLDAFRLDRLRSESLRQNCSNQLAMSRMKFGQLQEEFQQMSSKFRVSLQ